ncbi:MAG: ABC transporter substrate-binding protein [Chloroflexota bacterium]
MLQQIPMWSAYEGGFFKKYGFDPAPLLLASGRTALDSLIANQVDLISAGAYQTALSVGAGAKVRTIGVWSNKEPFVVFADKTIATPQQLPGAKVGTLGPASESAIAFYLYLHKLGIDQKQATYVTMTSVGDEEAALTAGAINVCAIIPPLPAETAAKVHVLEDLAKAGIAWIPNSWVVSQSTLEQQPDKTARMLEALEEGAAYAVANPTFGKDLLRKYMKMADSDLDQGFNTYKDLQAKDFVPTQEALDSVMAQLLDNQKDLTKEKIQPFYSSKVLDQLKASGFLAKSGAPGI